MRIKALQHVEDNRNEMFSNPDCKLEANISKNSSVLGTFRGKRCRKKLLLFLARLLQHSCYRHVFTVIRY